MKRMALMASEAKYLWLYAAKTITKAASVRQEAPFNRFSVRTLPISLYYIKGNTD